MSKVKAREVYAETKVIGIFDVIGRVVAFEQGWRIRHAVMVYRVDDSGDPVYQVDALMAYPSCDAEAVRHCIAAIDECIAQIERMQPQPAPIDPTDISDIPF